MKSIIRELRKLIGWLLIEFGIWWYPEGIEKDNLERHIVNHIEDMKKIFFMGRR